MALPALAQRRSQLAQQRPQLLHHAALQVDDHRLWDVAVGRQQAEAAFYNSSPAWSKCWAWWQFESTQPREDGTEEHLQLFQLGLLGRADTAKITEEAHKAYMASHYWHGPFQLFRRLPSWWALCSPEQRSQSETELEQLERLQQLVAPELELLNPTQAQQQQHWAKHAYLLRHLTAQEKAVIGAASVL